MNNASSSIELHLNITVLENQLTFLGGATVDTLFTFSFLYLKKIKIIYATEIYTRGIERMVHAAGSI